MNYSTAIVNNNDPQCSNFRQLRWINCCFTLSITIKHKCVHVRMFACCTFEWVNGDWCDSVEECECLKACVPRGGWSGPAAPGCCWWRWAGPGSPRAPPRSAPGAPAPPAHTAHTAPPTPGEEQPPHTQPDVAWSRLFRPPTQRGTVFDPLFTTPCWTRTCLQTVDSKMTLTSLNHFQTFNRV